MKGFLWRKWVARDKVVFYQTCLGLGFQERLIYREETFRKQSCFEIYLHHLCEGERLKRVFGGRILAYNSRTWEKSQRALRYPIRIGRQLLISDRPKTSKDLKNTQAKWLCIPAETAFGTGAHATTAMCLRALVRYYPFSSLIDVGTGSGVLAIAAAKLGCHKIVAFDNDPIAIRVAKRNAQRNKVKIVWKIKPLEKFKVKEKTEILVANLFSERLIHSSQKMASLVKKEGLLILSGIRSYQKAEVKEAFSFLIEEALFQKEGWCCMIFRKESA